MKHELTFASGTAVDRPLWPALGRGWHRRCPGCGGGLMFDGYLSVRRACASCGEAFHHHRADDAPAWVVIVITGKLLVVGMLYLELAFAPPVWVHWALWPTLALSMSLWLLPRVKGAIVGFQWASRMHGFSGNDNRVRDPAEAALDSQPAAR